MIQFYSPDIEKSGLLPPEESVHCVKVLRKREGDIIYVTDGKGRRYECRILEAFTRGVRLHIVSSTIVKKTWANEIVLAVAPTKNADRMAWLVEKSVEIGVDCIIFLKCSHNERKSINIERLRRNAISAMNQSLKTELPVLRDLTSLDSLIKEYSHCQALFGYCDIKEERRLFVNTFNPDKNLLLCIGPEGDFSKEEVAEMKTANFLPVTFGDERLRTETAALYALCGAHILYDKNNNN